MMIQSGAVTDRGRVRELNEDSCVCFSVGDTFVAVVADGMGGHNAGEVASAAAVDKISEYVKGNLETEPVRDCLLHAVEAANGYVYKMARSDRRYTAMGTTVVLCCVRDGSASIANVGDSRAFLIGEEIVQITEDQSVVEELVRRGEITKNEALTHPHRNMITRALGTEPRVIPDLFRCELSSEKILLLCSDGLSGLLEDAEIRDALSGEGALQEKLEQLVEAANERGGYDNITAVAVQMSEVQ